MSKELTEKEKERLEFLKSKKQMFIQAINSVNYAPKRDALIKKIGEFEDEMFELEFGKELLTELKETTNE